MVEEAIKQFRCRPRLKTEGSQQDGVLGDLLKNSRIGVIVLCEDLLFMCEKHPMEDDLWERVSLLKDTAPLKPELRRKEREERNQFEKEEDEKGV